MIAAVPEGRHLVDAGFISRHVNTSCYRPCTDRQIKTLQLLPSRKRVWEDEGSITVEQMSRFVRSRQADTFFTGPTDEEDDLAQSPEESSAGYTINTDEVETLADAFQVLMGADPSRLMGFPALCAERKNRARPQHATIV
eukprot:CAMPEP_0181307166 /NCGR_PEP_ID=MMETSP1101-20121128/10721_1 /TAXON_ID=46948 /ORGANISM="Rhodomonas abbreviata, Strain Caron Lab Isolate" /LENGTH=139 /DNA_ID=CAMNT_0023413337 /DNA_START=162 /DNA_END=582 /DNA_ORIENTATION=+